MGSFRAVMRGSMPHAIALRQGGTGHDNSRCGDTDYCSEEMDRLIEQPSQELDRLRNEYFTQWPYVKTLLHHDSVYKYARVQEVWPDR